MKKTKMRINRIMVLGLVATCLLASCKKEGNVPEGAFVATIEQNGGGNNSRTHINPSSWADEASVGVLWTKDDLIKVANNGGADGCDILTFQLTEGENTKNGTFYTGEPHENFFQPNNYVAIYPAQNAAGTANTISGTTATFNLLATQTYQENSFAEKSMPMVAYSTTQNLQFKNVLGCICFPLVGDGITLTKIVLTSNKASDKLWGTCNTTISTSGGDPTSTITNAEANANSITLNCGAPVTLDSETPTYFCIIVPPGTLTEGFTVAMYNGSDKIDERSTNKNARISRNVISETSNITVEPAPAPVFTEKAFTVASGRTVYFSPGNLQYNKTTHVWSFMEHQYDMVETAGQNVGENYSNQNIVSLFGWGTSGCAGNAGATHTSPTSTSTEMLSTDFFYLNPYGYGPTAPDLFHYPNLTGDYDDYDWGVYNAIYNPKTNNTDAAGTWRTLTKDEWDFLFTGRDDFAKKYGYATVGEKNGIIILPDSFDDPKKNENNVSGYFVGSNDGTGYNSNVYTADNWPYMEEAGAIFLPAAGSRNVTDVSGAGSNGYYWSTTNAVSSWSAQQTTAYCLSFASATCTPSSSAERCWGCSVRLVHE